MPLHIGSLLENCFALPQPCLVARRFKRPGHPVVGCSRVDVHLEDAPGQDWWGTLCLGAERPALGVVIHGVLYPLEPGDLGIPCEIRPSGVLFAEGLRPDLSRSGVVDNAAFRRLGGYVRRAALELAVEFARRSQQVRPEATPLLALAATSELARRDRDLGDHLMSVLSRLPGGVCVWGVPVAGLCADLYHAWGSSGLAVRLVVNAYADCPQSELRRELLDRLQLYFEEGAVGPADLLILDRLVDHLNADGPLERVGQSLAHLRYRPALDFFERGLYEDGVLAFEQLGVKLDSVDHEQFSITGAGRFLSQFLVYLLGGHREEVLGVLDDRFLRDSYPSLAESLDARRFGHVVDELRSMGVRLTPLADGGIKYGGPAFLCRRLKRPLARRRLDLLKSLR